MRLKGRRLIHDRRLLEPRPKKKEQILAGAKPEPKPTWGGSRSIAHWQGKLAQQAEIKYRQDRAEWARAYQANPVDAGLFESWRRSRK